MPRFIAALTLFALAVPARAELVSLNIHTREDFAGGKEFGSTGAYEKLVGVARFAVDPAHKRNRATVDLDLAPRNDAGKVEFSSDVYILKPKDISKGNGAILYDVNNRGNKLALGMFNSAPGSNDPTTEAHAGNGFLFRRGYAIVWSGWIGELLPGNHRLLLAPPIASEGGMWITGKVRFEMVTDRPADSLPLSRREGHGSHPPTVKGEREGVLTWRMRETDRRVVIPREQWSLDRKPVEKVKKGVSGKLGQVRVKLTGGFRPGYIYELICECEGPIVQGTGFAAVRDLISFLKHDTSSKNPLLAEAKSGVNRAHGFGVSQSGRFLRHLLYQEFNIDERDRKVFDGLMPHVAGGGLGYFNHRFAQPTRHNGQHEEHLYPCDVFPFGYGMDRETYCGVDGKTHRRGYSGSIIGWWKDEEKFTPKVLHTQSAAEYWHRSGSLVHTDTLGEKDAEIPGAVRIYSFGGTQHGPAARPPVRGIGENLLNPADYRPFLRGLLDALDAWVLKGTEPPPSVYPRIDKGTLVDWHQESTGFPTLPGVRYPEVIQRPPALDLGPRFKIKGLLPQEPPRVLGHYTVLVPKSGPDGNDQGCLLPVEVAVPLATYTGWNLRRRDVGAEGMLASLSGSYFPLPLTEAERKAKSDPRWSVEKRYGTFAEYRKRWLTECERLVKARYMLKEDADRLAAEVEKVRSAFSLTPRPPLPQRGEGERSKEKSR
jgi:hypothetical protein